MKITVDSLEKYGNWLNGIAKDASDQFKRAVLEYAAEMEAEHGDISGWSREQIEELRDFAADMMVEMWHTHGDASASVGSMMFEDAVGEEIPGDVMMSDQVSEERARASAKYWAKHLFGENASVGKFVDGCASFVDRNVSHAADVQMIELADELAASGREVRYARVPRGPSCGFCIMLASRGFVYASKKTAGDLGGAFNDFHDRCDCRVIAGYEGLEVEGYDYRGMYDRYLQCRKSIGDYEHVKKDWDALTPWERDQYGRGDRAIPLSEDPDRDAELRKQLGKQADGFNDYLARRIVQEMDTRDREWLYSGAVPIVDVSAIDVSRLSDEQKHVFEKERNCARVLANNGLRTSLIDDPNKKPVKGNPKFDYSIGGENSVWEAKCPEGNGYLAVAGNIAKADAKFRKIGAESKIVLSNLDSEMSDKQFRDYFEESLDDPESDYSNIKEIIFVFKDGSIRRWVR